MKLCQAEGVDLVFAPTPETVYPSGEPMTRVSAGAVGDRLEGDSRPGHFDGVLTVVAKLLHLSAPDVAYFGRKDAQQLWLIARMVTDLDFAVEIVAVPTVRDADGLALSSRNIYLAPHDRRAALALPEALRCADEAARRGSAADVLSAAAGVLSRAEEVDTDYVALVDPLTFEPVAPDFIGDGLLLVAARVGTTRLIDNSTVHLSGRG